MHSTGGLDSGPIQTDEEEGRVKGEREGKYIWGLQKHHSGSRRIRKSKKTEISMKKVMGMPKKERKKLQTFGMFSFF